MLFENQTFSASEFWNIVSHAPVHCYNRVYCFGNYFLKLKNLSHRSIWTCLGSLCHIHQNFHTTACDRFSQPSHSQKQKTSFHLLLQVNLLIYSRKSIFCDVSEEKTTLFGILGNLEEVIFCIRNSSCSIKKLFFFFTEQDALSIHTLYCQVIRNFGIYHVVPLVCQKFRFL